MSDRLALANAIEEAGIPRDKAQRVASVIFDAIHDNVATRADVQAMGDGLKAEIAGQVGSLRAELKSDIATTRADVRDSAASVRSLLASDTARLDTRIERLDATVKAQPNAIMLRLGTLMVVLTGIILAALRYLPPPHG
jgi:hypothetical protein